MTRVAPVEAALRPARLSRGRVAHDRRRERCSWARSRILTLLLLLRGEALKRKLIAIAGPRAQKKVTHDVIKAIDRQIERYLVARLLISAIVAAATWLGLWMLGVRQPLRARR